MHYLVFSETARLIHGQWKRVLELICLSSVTKRDCSSIIDSFPSTESEGLQLKLKKTYDTDKATAREQTLSILSSLLYRFTFFLNLIQYSRNYLDS